MRNVKCRFIACLLVFASNGFILTQTPFVVDPNVIWSYEGVHLLSRLSTVKTQFAHLKQSVNKFNLSDDITHYKGKRTNEEEEWNLSFMDVGNDDPVLMSIRVIKGGTLDDWNTIVSYYIGTLIEPVKLSEPELLPIYNARWTTGSGNTISFFNIAFNPEIGRLVVSLDVDEFAISGTSIEELLREIRNK